jgi:glycosyltransferase involved in cell wall biosynthesis
MNILYLTTHLNVGGITSYLLTLSKGYKNRGHNVYISSSGGESLPMFTTEGVIHIKIPIKTKFEFNFIKIGLSSFRLLKDIKEKNIQIIHSHTRVTQVLGAVLSGFTKRPHVTTCHGFFTRRFSRKLFPCWGDKVIAISDSVKENLMEYFKVPQGDIRLVYNGIDLERFTAPAPSENERIEAKQSFGMHDGPVIGIIGRLSDVKGHEYLIEAMQLVSEKVPNAQLLIIGEGKMQYTLELLTESLGLENKVFFIPKVLGTTKALSAIDIFVLPSLQEGLGLSLLEAMAAGIVCIGSDVGGIRNLIRNGYNGILVGPRDPKQISAAILELLRDKQKAQELAANAQAHAHKYFSQAEMLLRTEEVYRECLNERKLS